MLFIIVHSMGGSELVVNADHIVSMMKSFAFGPSHTQLTFDTGSVIDVMESIQQILSLIPSNLG